MSNVENTVQTTAPYKFNDLEINDLAKELATLLIEIQAVERERKDVMDEFKHKLDAKEKKANDLVEKIDTGQEERDYECKVEKDYADNKLTYVNVDDGEVVKIEKMGEEDFQMETDETNNL